MRSGGVVRSDVGEGVSGGVGEGVSGGMEGVMVWEWWCG